KDKKLLNLLQEDSKQTTKRLSLKLSLSVTAVYERIKKLEKEKIIKQYTAILDKKKIDKALTVFCNIKLDKHTKEHIVLFENKINKLPEVIECFHVSGEFDYILKIYIKDMESYREFMINKITDLKHIGSTHSVFTISDIKNTTAINL
ncbi:MAG TPA: AsnC family transcriptional regulator, partial [Tenacibaculum sp.]|nr:AsnC family transcriptional regulator [Tenacibaculum sp.]